MDQADLIWMNGEFVAWEDAKVHVLTHGLHYGTGVFEGVRCYDTELGPGGLPPRATTSTGCSSRPSSTTCRSRTRASSCAQATLELIARNGLRSCYIRPLVFRGYGTMGLFPLDAPVDVAIAVWEWGAYLGEEGKRNGMRAKVSLVAAHQPRLADPARQGLGPVPQLGAGEDRGAQGRLRGGDPPRRPRPRLRGLGREHLRRARRRRSSRRRRPRRSSTASTASRSIQIARDLGYRGRRARHRARRAVPGRRGLPDRHRRRARRRCARSTTTRSATASPARSRARSRRPSRTRCTGAPSATASGSTRCRPSRHAQSTPSDGRTANSGAVRSASASRRRCRSRLQPKGRTAMTTHRALRRHPARRHAGRGHVADRRREAARRAQARRARRRPDRGRLPGVEPQGARALRAARARDASRTPRSPPSG